MPPRARKEKVVEEEIDPFAPDQDNEPDGDEAQTEMPPPWEVEDNETEVKNADKEEKAEVKNVVEFGGGDRLSVTIKQHKGYEAGWIVLKGDTPADVLRTMEDPDFDKLMTWTKRASERFQEGSKPDGQGGNTGHGQNTSQNGSQGRTQGKPAAATEGPWGAQNCKHGVMSFKSGTSDDGSVWQGYFCPAPRNSTDKCKNKYVR